MSTSRRAASLDRRRVLAIVGPGRSLLGLVGALVLLSALLELVPPLVVRQVVDEHLALGRAEGLLPLALVYVAAATAVQALAALAGYLTAVAAQGALHRLRVALFDHYQRLPISYFDQNHLGDAISRCTADVETVETLFTAGVAKMVADLLRLVTVSIALVVLSPLLALLAAGVIPPLVLVTTFFQRRVREAEREQRRAVGRLTTHLQESLVAAEVIRAFRRERFFVGRFREALGAALLAYNRATVYGAFYPPAMALFAALAIALLLWAGGSETLLAWEVSVGTLTAFILLFQRFFQPIVALGDEWQTVQSALAGAERIFEVLSLPLEDLPTAPAGAGAVPRQIGPGTPDRQAPAAELRDVWFSYRPREPVLRNLSIELRAGEHLALVGRTGAGKSSILNLLGGLYRPATGTVRVVGLDPCRLTPESRRAIIGVVPQVVQLFNGSVYENLTLFDPGLARADVERAAGISGAAGFIEALPQGYETRLSSSGGGGVLLSAGQRQQLALARALVREPALLLLDEATAAIDSLSEAAIQSALREELRHGGRAVLTVAHRLSTAREADRVILLEDGMVVEEGPPDLLLARGGRFAALVTLEAAGWDWRERVIAE